MAVNLKLTRAIKDRVVQNFQLNASVLLISFVDGSKMTVTIAESLDVIFLLDLPKLGRTCAQPLIYSKLQNPIERNCR